MSERIYLWVPFEKANVARALGAKWDPARKMNYIDGENSSRANDLLSRFGKIVYIDVPYEEKDRAKEAGAKWDSIEKSWYMEEGSTLEFKERSEKIYIECDYKDRGLAKSYGAKWDSGAKLWYLYEESPELDDALKIFKRFVPLESLQGEIQDFGGSKIPFETPKEMINISRYMSSGDKSKVEKFAKDRANGRCEICNVQSELEIKFRFEYLSDSSVFILRRVMAVCKDCSDCFLLPDLQDDDRLVAHFVRVNGVSREECQNLINEALSREFAEEPEVDVSILRDSGINQPERKKETVKPVKGATTRGKRVASKYSPKRYNKETEKNEKNEKNEEDEYEIYN